MKKPNQNKIFFMYSPSRELAAQSPFAYPLTKAGVPVLIFNTQFDEAIVREMGSFEGMEFSSIETDTSEVEKMLHSLG